MEETSTDTPAGDELSLEPDADGEEAVSDSATALSRLESIVESVLFAAGAPVPLRRLVQILDGPSNKEVTAAVRRLQQTYSVGRRGLRLLEVAGGYQFRTAPENAEWVRALLREKPARLGRATVETLAIIAYKQPITRAEIEAIRGVDVEAALTSLLARRLIKIAGRKETVGRPLLYATTAEFLEAFGLKDLSDLPTLKELPSADATTVAPEPTTGAEGAQEAIDSGAGAGPAAETAQPSGGELAPGGGGIDPGWQGTDQRQGGEGAGDEGRSAPGPDHG